MKHTEVGPIVNVHEGLADAYTFEPCTYKGGYNDKPHTRRGATNINGATATVVRVTASTFSNVPGFGPKGAIKDKGDRRQLTGSVQAAHKGAIHSL